MTEVKHQWKKRWPESKHSYWDCVRCGQFMSRMDSAFNGRSYDQGLTEALPLLEDHDREARAAALREAAELLADQPCGCRAAVQAMAERAERGE